MKNNVNIGSLDKIMEDIHDVLVKNGVKLSNHDTFFQENSLFDDSLDSYHQFEVVQVPTTDSLWLSPGMSDTGPIQLNMREASNLLISGSSGTGKSKVIDTIICNLLENYSPNNVQICLLDVLGFESLKWKGIKQIESFHKVDEGCAKISDLVKDIDNRFKLMLKEGVTNINDYNKKMGSENALPFIIVMMPELYDYIAMLPKTSKGEYLSDYSQKFLFDSLSYIMSKSRKAGIHFIIGTQRPATLNSNVDAYCDVRLGLGMSTSQDSMRVIGLSGLEKMPRSNKGKGILSYDGLTKFQGYYITEDVITGLTEKHRVKD